MSDQSISIKTNLTQEDAVNHLNAATLQMLVAAASATASVHASLVGFTKAKLFANSTPTGNLSVLVLTVTGDEVEQIAELLEKNLPGNPKPAYIEFNVVDPAAEPEFNPDGAPAPTTPPPADASAPEAK